MTAPMVVAGWINLQYYGSTTDNRRFGSGNKVLHNVVGGAIGVLEGNAGDLRVGLPMQSLHDGKQWMHEPMRLSVFLEAPQAAIDDIIARHDAGAADARQRLAAPVPHGRAGRHPAPRARHRLGAGRRARRCRRPPEPIRLPGACRAGRVGRISERPCGRTIGPINEESRYDDDDADNDND
jgi:hypothetical protein